MNAELWTRRYVLAAFVMFAIFLASAILMPVMSIYAKNLTGLDTYTGMMTSMFTFGRCR